MAYHIYPISDYREHTLEGTTCDCRPSVQFENGEMLVIHNSYDGREHRELKGLEAYGKETHKYYEGDDLAKASTIYHTYLNYTSATRQPFTIDKVLEVRLVYSDKLKRWEETGKEELGYSPEFCKREIAGCDLLLKQLADRTAY